MWQVAGVTLQWREAGAETERLSCVRAAREPGHHCARPAVTGRTMGPTRRTMDPTGCMGHAGRDAIHWMLSCRTIVMGPLLGQWRPWQVTTAPHLSLEPMN
jgi:hypothetical protein